MWIETEGGGRGVGVVCRLQPGGILVLLGAVG